MYPLGIGPLSHSDYNGAFALRYMRMLVSPATALLYLCREDFLPGNAMLETTLIKLVERPRSQDSKHARDMVYRSLNQGLIDHLQSKGGYTEKIGLDAEEWLKKHWNAPNVPSESACHIHAEAGLMALACDIQRYPSKYTPEKHSNSNHLTTLQVGLNN